MKSGQTEHRGRRERAEGPDGRMERGNRRGTERRIERRAAPQTGRREVLLEAALRVVRRDGPAASMEAMAAAAGITKPILYRHFGDREGLIAAVAARFADDLVARLETALGTSQDPVARVRAAVAAYVGFIEEDPALYAFLAAHAPPASQALLGVVDRVAAVLEGAIVEGLLAAGLPAEAAARAATGVWADGVAGMVHLAGARWAAQPGGISRQQLVEELTGLVAEGILGVAARSGAPAPAPAPSQGGTT